MKVSPAPRSASSTPFRLWTVEEIEKLSAPEWLIDGILPLAGFGVLFGEPGKGKSFVALDWANHIATGENWFGRDVKNGDVIYVYAEGAMGLKNRLDAWRKKLSVQLDRVFFLPHSLNMLDESEIARLIVAIEEHCQPRLIIIDTLARNFGDGDENNGKDMNAFVSGVERNCGDHFQKQRPWSSIIREKPGAGESGGTLP